MIKYKQHILITVYCIFIMFLFGFTACCKQENNEPIFVHKVYNDTFKINVVYGPAPDFQDTTKIDTLYYDVNNDGSSDFIAIYSRIVNFSETSFGFGSLNNDYFAYDSLFSFKSFKENDTISESNFTNQNLTPYRIFNSNPAGLNLKVDVSNIDTVTGIYYIAIIDNSFGSINHNFTWFKFQFYQNTTTGFLGLIILESGYNVTPLNTIKIGEY